MKCAGKCEDKWDIGRPCCQLQIISRWPPEDHEAVREMIKRVQEAHALGDPDTNGERQQHARALGDEGPPSEGGTTGDVDAAAIEVSGA